MARSRLWILVAAASLLAACGQPDGGTQGAGDLLYVRSGGEVSVFAAGSQSPSFRDDALPSGDWSTAVRSAASGPGTRLTAVDPTSGEELWERRLAGDLRVKVVSQAGDAVALGPRRERYFSLGRKHTRLMIVRGELDHRRFVLDGNYEPEAFSTDGKSLFLVNFLPARRPTSYQVRRLDLTSGRVEAVYTPDGHLQERMGGTARVQAMSSDGMRLYTLYTLGQDYAFVHVLDLENLWAHCIDLPDGFADSVESAGALSVSPTGKKLYVANSASGYIAEVDTESLKVVRSESVGFFGGKPHIVADEGSTVYVATSTHVAALDATDLTEERTWHMPERVRGLQVTADAARLYVGLKSKIVVLDTATGSKLIDIDPPGIARIQQFGPVMSPVAQPRSSFVCGC